MNINPLNKGMIEVNSSEIGEVSDEMISKRAKELALIAGLPVTKEDREQALHELTGADRMDTDSPSLESFSEDDRWNPIPVSTGHQAPQSTLEDQDEDGQNVSAQLFEEGVSEAAHDQMLQAALAADKEE